MNNDLCDEVLSSLRRIARAVDLQSRQLVRSHGLTGPQIFLLKVLSGLGETTVGRLAEYLNSSKPTVTDILNRLEKQQLVTRVRSDRDKRCVHVKVTALAQKKLKTSPPLLQEAFARRFGELQKWEQFQLLSSLHKVAELMDVRSLDESLFLSNETVLSNSGDIKSLETSTGGEAAGNKTEFDNDHNELLDKTA